MAALRDMRSLIMRDTAVALEYPAPKGGTRLPRSGAARDGSEDRHGLATADSPPTVKVET
jgi:hypothetical protein